jgi:hypothetical protein
MSNTTIDPSAPNSFVVETTRTRQTERPASPFKDVLAGSISVLATGAEVMTGVVAGPIAAAAVHQGGAAIQRSIVSPGVGSGLDSAASLQLNAPATTEALTNPDSSAGTDITQMHAMQKESQVFNLQLLQLQENIQNENRHFTTVSNVLRASHDTAKAAISNVRS